MRIPKFIKYLLIYSAGHNYSNLSRLFLRLFTGVMFMQFGIRQWTHFSDLAPDFVSICGMSPQVSLILMITVEIVCSTMIILGLFSRAAIIPPLVSMIVAEDYVLASVADPSALSSSEPGYVPMLFIGIFVFMFLAGPGKISLDYLITSNLAHLDKEMEDSLNDA